MKLLYARKKLPEGFRLKMRIDLMRSRKHLKRVVWLSFAAVLLCIAGGWLLRASPAALLDGGFGMLLLRLLVLIAGLLLYICAHEAVHGLLMWLISREKPRFGFKLMYAYAGSTACFSKWAYLWIALAPMVVWGIVFAWLCSCVSDGWFWIVWGWQMANLSGAAGDVYVACRILPLDSRVLIQDSGAAMMVYHQP